MVGIVRFHNKGLLQRAPDPAPGQTEANLQGHRFNPDKRMGPADAILLTADLAVRGSLTRLDVRVNRLSEEGKEVLRTAVEGRSGFDLLL